MGSCTRPCRSQAHCTVCCVVDTTVHHWGLSCGDSAVDSTVDFAVGSTAPCPNAPVLPTPSASVPHTVPQCSTVQSVRVGNVVGSCGLYSRLECGIYGRLHCGLYCGLYCRFYCRLGCGLYCASVPPVSQCPVPTVQNVGLEKALVSCARLCQSRAHCTVYYAVDSIVNHWGLSSGLYCELYYELCCGGFPQLVLYHFQGKPQNKDK